MSKLIIVGPPFAGKSTLVGHLRANNSDLKVVELDEMIIEANGGKWPTEEHYRNHILLPKVVDSVVSDTSDLIFVTSYISPEHILRTRESGAMVVQLTTSPSILISRNVEGDMGRQDEMHRNLEYQQMLQNQHLVDVTIDASKTTQDISDEVLRISGHGEKN